MFDLDLDIPWGWILGIGVAFFVVKALWNKSLDAVGYP